MREFYSSLPSLLRLSLERDVPPPDFVSKVPSPDVEVRARAFRAQLADWARSGRFGVPLLVLPDAPLHAEGACVSCGAALGGGQTWRCALCVAAVRAALGMAE